MRRYETEIAANMERADESLKAARELADSGFHDIAASRAYYAAFYAATAVLLNEGFELSKHSGVIASIHQHLVKTGKLSIEHGRQLNWLFELRNVGDYGVTLRVSAEDAGQAIQVASDLVVAVQQLLWRSGE